MHPSMTIDEQMDEIAKLEYGWYKEDDPDAPGQAYPVEHITKTREWLNAGLVARKILPPEIIPSPCGGLSLLWDIDEHEISCYLSLPQMSMHLTYTKDNGTNLYRKDFNLLNEHENNELIEWLEKTIKDILEVNPFAKFERDMCAECIEKTSGTCQGGHAFQPGCLQFDYGED